MQFPEDAAKEAFLSFTTGFEYYTEIDSWVVEVWEETEI